MMKQQECLASGMMVKGVDYFNMEEDRCYGDEKCKSQKRNLGNCIYSGREPRRRRPRNNGSRRNWL